MDDQQLWAVADGNVQETVEHFGRHGAGAVLSRRSGVVLLASATDFAGAYHNAALRVTPDTDPRRVVREARAFGKARERDIVLWVAAHRDHDLAAEARAEGLQFRSTTLGMALDAPPPAPRLPGEVELVQVTDRAGVDAFAAVHRDVFHAAGRDARAVDHFASTGSLLAPNVAALVASVDDKPVSCAMVVHSGRAAGIYWVATRAAVRNRGLGTLVARVAARTGFNHGAEVVVLQATELGASVYRKLGFTAFTHYHRFLVPFSA